MLFEKLVDTPVRGVVYEAALPTGEAIARDAAQRWQMPVEIVAVGWRAGGCRPPARAIIPGNSGRNYRRNTSD